MTDEIWRFTRQVSSPLLLLVSSICDYVKRLYTIELISIIGRRYGSGKNEYSIFIYGRQTEQDQKHSRFDIFLTSNIIFIQINPTGSRLFAAWHWQIFVCGESERQQRAKSSRYDFAACHKVYSTQRAITVNSS